jgi:DNA-directed RNA polymerase specialized sigma24 family protein
VELADRDPKAEIERIYRDRYVSFCRVAIGVTGRADTAREAVQDGFALALAHRDEFRGDGSLEGWVGRIVLRAALDVRRRPAPDPVGVDDLGHGVLLWGPELPHGDRDPALVAAVESLPPRQRQVVFLRYFADLANAQVAEMLGISPGTVSALLHQARTALAQRLECQQALPEEVQR